MNEYVILALGGLTILLLFVALTRANVRSMQQTIDDATRPTWTPDPRPGPPSFGPLLRFGLDDLTVIEGDARPLPALPADVTPTPTLRLPPAPSGWEVSRWTPARAPTPASDLAVPLGQALGLALAVGIGGGLVAWALSWSWRVVALAAGATLVLAVLWRLRVADGLLQVVETAIGKDLTGDGRIGRPVVAYGLANPAVARAAVARETRQAADDARLQELLAFADKCYLVGCSEAAHGVTASGPDRAAFVEKRDALLRLGVAAWRHPDRPKAGWRMAVDQARARELLAHHVL
jgi:hypothetical protein